MAIDAYGKQATSTTAAATSVATAAVDKTALSKDDFLKLLLLELKYQDPTAPMDSEKILSQTSQLATLESAENTNKALETLAASLSSSMQYQGISAIGKLADTGSNAIVKEEGKASDFQIYFPDAVSSGNVNILDNNGKILRSMAMGETAAGNAQFSWDGIDSTGKALEAGIYYAEASYTKTDGTEATSRVGIYPIESIKFDSGKTYAKLGGSYVDFSSIKEVSAN